MIRGTTPTHTFTIPFDTSSISDLRISYVQKNVEVLVKTKNDCVLEKNKIVVKLSQKETFKFTDKERTVLIQIRVLTYNDEVLCSEIMSVDVERCLNDEVLG